MLGLGCSLGVGNNRLNKRGSRQANHDEGT